MFSLFKITLHFLGILGECRSFFIKLTLETDCPNIKKNSDTDEMRHDSMTFKEKKPQEVGGYMNLGGIVLFAMRVCFSSSLPYLTFQEGGFCIPQQWDHFPFGFWFH